MAANPQVKAQIMAALLAGQGITEVANIYGVNKGTVSRWAKEARIAIAPAVLPTGATEKKEVGSLVRECMEACLTAVKEIARVASEPEYIRKQSANELAVLGGVLADKGIRILEAAEAARGEDGDPPAP